MVAVFNKELLSWYLITLKLKETVEAGIPLQSPNTSQSIDLSEVQQPHHQLHKQQQQPFGSETLREGDDKAYIPQTVTIGPYHHGRRRLHYMDRHKWPSFDHILKHTGHDIKLYLDSIKELEERVRACYEGTITLNSNEFVETMVLDGCFILELFRGTIEGFRRLDYSGNDPSFAMRGSMHSIQRDMIMLENQIPLFDLDRLLGLQFGQPDQKGLVVKLALQFFDPLMPTDEPLMKSDRNRMESSLGVKTHTFDRLLDQGGLNCLDVSGQSLLRKGPKSEPRIWIKRWPHVHRVADKRRQQLIQCHRAEGSWG